jgi:hypothetical protein
LGVGAFDPVGDAKQLTLLGTPRWVLAAFGLAAVISGMWIWERVSPQFGFGRKGLPADRRDTLAMAAIAICLTGMAFALGNHG